MEIFSIDLGFAMKMVSLMSMRQQKHLFLIIKLIIGGLLCLR